MNAHETIARAMNDHRTMLEAMSGDPGIIDAVGRAAHLIAESLKAGGAVFAFGNGGSAADAQHIAGELVGRFAMERKGLRATALTADSSVATSLANDYGFEEVFARQIEALGRPGDIALAISTSGNSPNILRAVERARAAGLKVIGLSGKGGGKMNGACDILITVPSGDTPRIQEGHALVYHILCGLVEREVFGG
jgi:D-sedoheptulose 7-phosphate isomerase